MSRTEAVPAGALAADAVARGSIRPPSPLYSDPPHGAPTDPVVLRGPHRADGVDEWWMFYTQRRSAAEGPGVSWVHGSDIGVATSTDGGISWAYRGVVEGIDPRPGRNTLWAPEILFAEGRFHMFVTYIEGVPDRWEGHARSILHHVSDDLVSWEYRGVVPLSSDRVIDACVFPLPAGGYRMWFKEEAAGSATWAADSPDLETWGPSHPVITSHAHEGPNVFALGGRYWLIVDEWQGLGVYRSADLETWDRAGRILDAPGRRVHDATLGHHADVVVGSTGNGEEVAWIFYFTHHVQPGSAEAARLDAQRDQGGPVPESRRTEIQVAQARVVGDVLVCDRDAPVDLDLRRVR
jgi:hypothetical protein